MGPFYNGHQLDEDKSPLYSSTLYNLRVGASQRSPVNGPSLASGASPPSCVNGLHWQSVNRADFLYVTSRFRRALYIP